MTRLDQGDDSGIDEALGRLHRAGWSVGDAASRDGAGGLLGGTGDGYNDGRGCFGAMLVSLVMRRVIILIHQGTSPIVQE
jgi:hypothetical protein